ncbi:hypothetical protein [Nocardia sp. NPDC059239]|uniref:hypothetical protein n=1 Tax=unclassified Nocardia TaxID=2637762 RepID=UPI0036C0804C
MVDHELIDQLLQAAGFAPAYPDVPVRDPRWQPVTTAIDRLLRAHEPYPALVR